MAEQLYWIALCFTGVPNKEASECMTKTSIVSYC